MHVSHMPISGDHSILKLSTELEVMMTIAHSYQLQDQHSKDLNRAIAQAGASRPACRSYLNTIGAFVASYAGGESFKLLKYLDFIGILAAFIWRQPLEAPCCKVVSSWKFKYSLVSLSLLAAKVDIFFLQALGSSNI